MTVRSLSAAACCLVLFAPTLALAEAPPRKTKKPKPAAEQTAPVPAPPPPAPPPPPPPATTTTVTSADARETARDDGARHDGDAEASLDRPISASALVGYASNGLHAGLGVRAGYDIMRRFYVGGTFVHHFGSSEDGGGATSSVHYEVFGVEGGYELPLGPILLRPYLGLGDVIAATSVTIDGQDSSDSASSFALWPGARATFAIPNAGGFYVGADLRVMWISKSGDASVQSFVDAGMRF